MLRDLQGSLPGNWLQFEVYFVLPTLIMKTASLGLLEVPVVRVNAGGDAPPDLPSVGDFTGPPFPLSCFLQEIFLAN